MSRHCDEDYCWTRQFPLDGCSERICPEHSDDKWTDWNDGTDFGSLHKPDVCPACDSCWDDVKANIAFNASERACKLFLGSSFHDPDCAYCAATARGAAVIAARQAAAS